MIAVFADLRDPAGVPFDGGGAAVLGLGTVHVLGMSRCRLAVGAESDVELCLLPALDRPGALEIARGIGGKGRHEADGQQCRECQYRFPTHEN